MYRSYFCEKWYRMRKYHRFCEILRSFCSLKDDSQNGIAIRRHRGVGTAHKKSVFRKAMRKSFAIEKRSYIFCALTKPDSTPQKRQSDKSYLSNQAMRPARARFRQATLSTFRRFDENLDRNGY